MTSSEMSVNPNTVRVFASGATRDTNDGKLVYTGFLSPTVLESYAKFMHKNRFQRDGNIRAADNWKKGIPQAAYLESLGRHFMEVWLLVEGGGPIEELKASLHGVMFNSMGMLHEILKEEDTNHGE